METPEAAAVSLYKFAIRSTIGDNYPPECAHYLPLFMIDGNGNPTPVIASLGPPAGQTASQSGDTTFVVKNEFGVKRSTVVEAFMHTSHRKIMIYAPRNPRIIQKEPTLRP